MNQHTNKSARYRALLGSLIAVGLLIPAMGASPASSMTRLDRHVPLAASSARDLGRMNGSTRLTLSIPIRLRDPDGLDAMIKRLYDPQDSMFHKFLTPQQFADQFAATADTVAAVTNELTGLGLNVTDHSSRTLVKVEASVSAIESAFNTEIHLYQDQNGHRFRAPTANPLVKQAFADQIQMIAGLHNSLRAHHHLRAKPQDNSCAANTNAPANGFSPAQIRQAYNLTSSSLNGSGQTLGLFECDGYTASDITAYANQYALGTSKLTNVLVDGASGQASQAGGGVEVSLDIEVMLALAPEATIRVYMIPADTATGSEADNGCTDQEWLDLLQRVADDNSATAISDSWAFAESDAITDGNFLTSEYSTFAQMASQGQAFLAAAGDTAADNGDTDSNGNNVVGVEDPPSQPYVLGVGGTTLAVTTSGAYANESVWNNVYGGGGGGISQKWPTPSWQINTATKANGGNAAWRSVPDVSLNADPCTGYSIYFTGPEGPGENGTETYGGGWDVVAGTSAASPLWAAFLGLVNEQRTQAGLTKIGFPNPTLYQLGEGSQFSAAMHDITAGNNIVYYATTGYDLASGWGSFNGGGFLQSFQSAGLPPVTPMNFHVQTVNP